MGKKFTKDFWVAIHHFKKVVDYRYGVNCYGDVIDFTNGKILHQKIANKKHHPYHAVNLKQTNGKSEWYLVHQLVATYFVDVPKRLRDIPDIVPNHKDNDGLNNYYKNLEWLTRGENTLDAFRNGYINNSCENHTGTDISDDEVHSICKMLESGMRYKDILNEMGYPNDKKHKTLLVRIKNGIAWKEISALYDIDSKTPQYTDEQLDTISKLGDILNLYEQGLKAKDIYKILYADYKGSRDTKLNVIRNVCKHRIFKDEINKLIQDKRSTTIES